MRRHERGDDCLKDLIDRKAGRMKLIDAPVGVFVFRDELVLKTEYKTDIDGVYIPDCYILSTGEKFWGGMKSKEDFKTKYNNLDVEVIDIMSSAHLESKRQATVSSDCISRQDAKDVVDMELDAIDHVPEWVYDRLLTALDQVPSAQAELAQNLHTTCTDTISRQAAIDALDQIFDRCEEIEAHLPEGDPDRTGYKMYPDYMTVWKYLHQLPSVQPEQIIRCTNCRFFKRNIPCTGGHYNGCEMWLDDGNEIRVMTDDYCSKALPKEGEQDG